MQTLFSEVTQLCRSEEFLHSVIKKYHYAEDEITTLRQVAEQMQQCIGAKAGWQDVVSSPFCVVGITLGAGVDTLQEGYLGRGLLTESYMIEVLSSELLLKSYEAYTEWVAEHRDVHVERLLFLGSVTGDAGLNEKLRIENLPALLRDLELPVTCNEAYCMIPKKSVVFYAALTQDPNVRCAGICMGCGRKDCPNRMEEKEDFPLHFADMTDRPLPYGYSRIFSRGGV